MHPENVERLTKFLSYQKANSNTVSTATKTRSSKSTATKGENKKKITNKKKLEKSKKSRGIAKIIRRKNS